MKILTIIYPIYKYDENEINNIISTTNALSNLVDILVLSDNPEINDSLDSKLKKLNLVLVKSEKNIGKYQLIKNAADDGLINTKWFKICDPDDMILFENVKKFNSVFSKEKNTPFIRFMPSLRVEPGDWKIDEINRKNNRIKIMKKRMFSIVNENSVHPTIDIINFDLNIENQTKSSDVLFSLASTINNRKIKNFSKSFYIYNLHKGISSETNDKKYNHDLMTQLISYLDIMIKYKDLNKMKCPSFYDYKWAHNYILNSDLNFEDRTKIMSEIFYKLKKSAKDNFNWHVKWSEKELRNYLEKLKSEIKL